MSESVPSSPLPENMRYSSIIGEVSDVPSEAQLRGRAAVPISDLPKIAMVLPAHPDDAEFGAGGTLARLARDGWEVHYLVATDGSKGSQDPDMTAERLRAIREKEQLAAAEAIAGSLATVTFLGYVDGELEETRALRERIVREIRRRRPTIMFTHDGWQPYQFHSDHTAIGKAAFHASFNARDRLYFPDHEREGLPPHKVREIYLWGSTTPDAWVDIGDTLEVKIEALARHASQVVERPHAAEFVREWARSQAKGQAMEYAERFKKLMCRP